MRYLSVCSGIEAATVAWKHLGWEAAAFSDIEAFPRAVLKHHYPDVPLHGRERRRKETLEDYAAEAGFQTIRGDEYGSIDLLVGGTPCQSFSIAGRRGGMADNRGNLALEYIRLARRARARWVVWENVPGVLSSNEGEDFRCFLSGLAGWQIPLPKDGWKSTGIIPAGPVDGAYGLAYRVLDAQHFGVAQRRRRVFVVGYLGDWRRALAVLIERHSLSGDPSPREKGRQHSASRAAQSTGGDDQELDHFRMRAFGDYEGDGTASTIKARDHKDATDLVVERKPLPTIAIQERASAKSMSAGPQSKGMQDDLAYTLESRHCVQAVAVSENQRAELRTSEVTGAIASEHSGKAGQGQPTIAFTAQDRLGDIRSDCSPTLRAGNSNTKPNGGVVPAIVQYETVRKVTPRECERLQGFPDDYTLIPWGSRRKIIAQELLWLRLTRPDLTMDEAVRLAADSPRYKAIGNSMATPVMRWIGERIAAVEAIGETT